MPRHHLVLPGLSVIALSACVVKPTTIKEYDQQCQIERRSVVLEMEQIEGTGMFNCTGSQDCKAAFIGQAVGAALILPVSAMISSAIAVTSNSYYWISESNACKDEEASDETTAEDTSR